jgi:hypothetical protein
VPTQRCLAQNLIHEPAALSHRLSYSGPSLFLYIKETVYKYNDCQKIYRSAGMISVFFKKNIEYECNSFIDTLYVERDFRPLLILVCVVLTLFKLLCYDSSRYFKSKVTELANIPDFEEFQVLYTA